MQSHTSGATHFPPFRQAGLQIAVRIQNYIILQLRYFHTSVGVCDHTNDRIHKITNNGVCLFVTCFAVGTTISLLAATRVRGRTLHVSTAGMSAHGWGHKWHANTNNTWSNSLHQQANTYLPPSAAWSTGSKRIYRFFMYCTYFKCVYFTLN